MTFGQAIEHIKTGGRVSRAGWNGKEQYSELCLLATKGKPSRVSKSVHQVCDARVMRHSRKPDEIRDKIVELCGDLPRVELFARERCDGWDAIGNEIDGRDIRDVLPFPIYR